MSTLSFSWNPPSKSSAGANRRTTTWYDIDKMSDTGRKQDQERHATNNGTNFETILVFIVIFALFGSLLESPRGWLKLGVFIGCFVVSIYLVSTFILSFM
jgi:hypothetical protein